MRMRIGSMVESLGAWTGDNASRIARLDHLVERSIHRRLADGRTHTGYRTVYLICGGMVAKPLELLGDDPLLNRIARRHVHSLSTTGMLYPY